MSNFLQRVLSSAILIPVVIFIIYNDFLFHISLILLTILMSYEWFIMIHDNYNQETHKIKKKYYYIFTSFLTVITIYSIYELRYFDIDILLIAVILVWITDISAFFTGKMIGGAKLCPSLSPGKTISGFIGSILFSIIFCSILSLFSNYNIMTSINFAILFAILVATICQISDLIESKIKRIFNVKDSGNLIKGHGGILDRIDSMMLSLPFILFVVKKFQLF